MSKKKKNSNYKQLSPADVKKKSSAMSVAQQKAAQKYSMKKGALSAGGYVALIGGAICLIASFVLTVISAEFPYKQPITFFLMSAGAGTIAYFSNLTIKQKGTKEKPTAFFWILVVLSVVYFVAAVYSLFGGNIS